MAEGYIQERTPVTPYDEALVIAQGLRGIARIELPAVEPIAREPDRAQQWGIINAAITPRDDREKYLTEKITHPTLKGFDRQHYLLEYTTMRLSRQLALQEEAQYDKHQGSGKNPLQFFVHDAGMEILHTWIFRHMDNQDAAALYYRGTTPDLWRGGTVEEQLAMDYHTVGDTHSRSRQLGGHMASDWRSILPTTSMTGPHFPHAEGVGHQLNQRIAKGKTQGHKRFNRPDAIAVAITGEATFNQEEVLGSVRQSVLDKAAVGFVCANNGAGISMDLSDTAIDNDPIAALRGLANHGLKIIDVDTTDLASLAKATREFVRYVREERKPALLHAFNLFRVTDHTSSSNQPDYIAPDELQEQRGHDMLTDYHDLLIEAGVATRVELQAITDGAQQTVEAAIKVAKDAPNEPSENLYLDVYPGPQKLQPTAHPEIPTYPNRDRVKSTREKGVDYTDGTREGDWLTYRQYITRVLAEEMMRDERIQVWGEDVATLTQRNWNQLGNYFEQRADQLGSKYGPEIIRHAMTAITEIRSGRGHSVDPDLFAAVADIIKGKGGVFGKTKFLQLLFGDRVKNSPLSEAMIIGRSIGEAFTDDVIPVAEIQFGPYMEPAAQQLLWMMSTARWRSAGQWDTGMVVRVQDGNRIGPGVGGIGHGNAEFSRYWSPGVRVAVPGDAIEAGCMMREAIRMARTHRQDTIIYECISENIQRKGKYQGPDAHIPLGESQIRRRSDSDQLTLIGFGNNVPLLDEAADQLAAQGINVAVGNTRGGFMDQLDLEGLAPIIKSTGKILLVEAGRGKDTALISAAINERFFVKQDAPIWRMTARGVPMPAGRENELYVVPQTSDIVQGALNLLAY